MEIPSRLVRVVALLGFPCIVILVILALLNSTTNPLNPKVEQNNNKLSECVPVSQNKGKLIELRCQIFNEGLELVEKEFNSTTKFLKRPEEYAEVAEKCAEAIVSGTEKQGDVIEIFQVCALITNKASNDSAVIRKYKACQFLVFYFSTFKNCANSLYNSTETPCLETIFHHDIEV